MAVEKAVLVVGEGVSGKGGLVRAGLGGAIGEARHMRGRGFFELLHRLIQRVLGAQVAGRSGDLLHDLDVTERLWFLKEQRLHRGAS